MEKKKSVSSNILIITLILIIFTASAIGIYAWARNRAMSRGTATAQVARWSFKIVDGVAETSDVIDFAVTRTDTNPDVTEGNIAPGTYGEFEIGIDARGTETILEYAIEVALTNKPTNLKLYSDSEKTTEIEVTDNILSLSGFMDLEDVNEIKVEKIYWEWPFETGENEAEILANDLIDAEFLGKTISMEIAVTGTEVLEETVYLADVVNVGDYVDYNASSNGTYTFTSEDCLAGSSISKTISTDDSFNSDAPAQWRVLTVNKGTKTVELISADPTQSILTLKNEDGFNNAVDVLNNIGAIYGHGKGATNGRSITKEDILKHTSIVPNLNQTRTYTSGSYFREIKDTSGNIVDYEKNIVEATADNQIIMTQNYYSMYIPNDIEDKALANTLALNSTKNASKVNYWLASRCVSLYSSYCEYLVDSVQSNSVGGNYVYNSRKQDRSPSCSVTPIVTLKANMQTTGQDENGVWKLKVN